MGKRIISQARGKGGKTYRVRRKAYSIKVGYPQVRQASVGKILKLVNSSGHSCPLAKIMINKEIFHMPAAQGVYEGQEIEMCGEAIEPGNIVKLGNIPMGTRIFNIEIRPGDGGKLVRTSGGYATVLKTDNNYIILLMNNKKQVRVHKDSSAAIGEIAGQGRTIKPIVKAGKKHHMMKSRNKLWPRTSAVKMNAIDHPFGGGRGKRIKSKIAKRNAPPGRRVGHIRPRRTGKK